MRRYERASLIITSNKSILDWGDIFNDHVLATAILDRLLHHSTTLNIQGYIQDAHTVLPFLVDLKQFVACLYLITVLAKSSVIRLFSPHDF